MSGFMRVVAGLVLVAASLGAGAQAKSERAATGVTEARYYKLTLNLTFGASGDAQATTQTITTEFALRGSIQGTCKARMMSPIPVGTGSQERYINVGTNFDANEIHLEGDGVAMHFVLSASRPVRMISYAGSDGKTVDEPIITDRTVELSVKVPLDTSKVVFDSSAKKLEAPKPVKADAKIDPAVNAAVGLPPQVDQPMTVEIGVTELK